MYLSNVRATLYDFYTLGFSWYLFLAYKLAESMPPSWIVMFLWSQIATSIQVARSKRLGKGRQNN